MTDNQLWRNKMSFFSKKEEIQLRNPMDDLPDLGRPFLSYRQTRNIADLPEGRIFTIGDIPEFLAAELNGMLGLAPDEGYIKPEHLTQIRFNLADCAVMLNEEQERWYIDKTSDVNLIARAAIDNSTIRRLNIAGNKIRLIEDAILTQEPQATVYIGELGKIVERYVTNKRGGSQKGYKCAVVEVALPIIEPGLGDDGFAVMSKEENNHALEEERIKTNRLIYFMNFLDNLNRQDLITKYGLFDGNIRKGIMVYELDAPGIPYTAVRAATVEPTIFGTERKNYGDNPLIVSKIEVFGLEKIISRIGNIQNVGEPRQVISALQRQPQPRQPILQQQPQQP